MVYVSKEIAVEEKLQMLRMNRVQHCTACA
jgi:hypothetical protein